MSEHEKVILNINGIDCEIDKECVDWVCYFNKIGLKTQYCCQGDDTATSNFLIVFDKSVKDEDVLNFLKENYKIWGFYKWVRTGHSNSELFHNWIFSPKTKDIAKTLFNSIGK